MTQQDELIKQREIRFCQFHPNPEQAKSVLLLLSDADGILDVRLIDSLSLVVNYDIRYLTLQAIEKILGRLGFHLDNRLLTRMKRALVSYSEDTQRDNLQIKQDTDTTTLVFVKRYNSNFHGCRDKRPTHWRKYL